MTFYCLCEAHNDQPDSQTYGAPNRYCAPLKDTAAHDFPPLALRRAMTCLAVGVPQVVLVDPKPNDWTTATRPSQYRQHYPAVDVYECPHCRARMVRA